MRVNRAVPNRMPLIQEERLGSAAVSRQSSQQQQQQHHTPPHTASVISTPPSGPPLPPKVPSLRSSQSPAIAAVKPHTPPSRTPLPQSSPLQQLTPPAQKPNIAQRSLPTTPQIMTQSPPLRPPPHVSNLRSPSPKKQSGQSPSPFANRPVAVSRRQNLPPTPVAAPYKSRRSPPLPATPHHADLLPPQPPPHSFDNLGFDSFLPESRGDAEQYDAGMQTKMRYMSLSDLGQQVPVQEALDVRARPLLNVDTSMYVTPRSDRVSVSPPRSSHELPESPTSRTYIPAASPINDLDNTPWLPPAGGYYSSDVSPTRSNGSYSGSSANVSPVRSDSSSRRSFNYYGSSPGEMMSDDEEASPRLSRWYQRHTYQSSSSPIPSPPKHFVEFSAESRQSYHGQYDGDGYDLPSQESFMDYSRASLPPNPPPHAMPFSQAHPARANTTGRVPLSTEGNLYSQRMTPLNAASWRERRAHASLSGAECKGREFDFGAYEPNEELRDDVYDPADRSQLDLYFYSEAYDENAPSSIIDESMIPVAGTTVASMTLKTQEASYEEDEEEADDLEAQATMPISPLRIVKMAEQPPLPKPSTRPESPTESATSTHADTNAMKRYGLPTSIPDTNIRATSTLKKAAATSEKTDDRSYRPWALSDVYKYLRIVMAQEANFMREEAVINSLGEMFKRQLPVLSTIVAEDCAIAMINSFLMHGVMERIGVQVRVPEETEPDYLTKVANLSGVLPLLAGHGCYSQCWRFETGIEEHRCYSMICSLTTRKAATNVTSLKSLQNADNWSEAVPEYVSAGLSRSEIVRQNIIFEFIASEGRYLANVRSLLNDFRDVLLRPSGTKQPIVANPKKFVKDVIQNTEEILNMNDKYLYQPLLARQREEYVVSGIGDILMDWIKMASDLYIKHGAGLGRALELYNDEKLTNPRFSQFVSDFLSKHPGGGILAVHTRLTRYPLLIRRMIDDGKPMSMERSFLERAYGRLSELGHSFQTTFSSSQRKYILQDLDESIKFPNANMRRNLHLDSKNRKVLLRTPMDLRIRNGKRQALFLILLDNYLLITKEVTTNSSKVRYDIVTPPIPMDFLVLLSSSDESSSGHFMNLPKSATMPNLNAVVSTSPGEDTKKGGENKLIYPFRVRHLGRDGVSYTMLAKTSTIRENWCSSIMLAKNQHALSLVSLRCEPFALDVVADMAFAYDSEPSELPVMSAGTNVERALRAAESDAGIPARSTAEPMIKSRVNCAVAFFIEELGAYAQAMSNNPSKKPFVLVGCEYGVYISDGSPRFWAPVLALPKVRQMRVLPEFGIVIILSDKTLMAYNLEALLIADPFKFANVMLSPAARIEKWLAKKTKAEVLALAPQQISESREIVSFTVGILRGRTVIICRKRESNTTAGLVTADDGVSTVKIYEPIAGRSIAFTATDITLPQTDDITRVDRLLGLRSDVNGYAGLKAGKDLARETDLIVTPKPCLETTILKKAIVLHTTKGELLTVCCVSREEANNCE